MTGTDYSKAKKLHPKLKVRNVKRLIAAIRKSEHLDLAMAKARKNPLKIRGQIACVSDATFYSAESMADSRVPLVFHMPTWMDAAAVDPDRAMRMPKVDSPVCGTAACIAGFAGDLMARGGALDSEAKRRVEFAICVNHGWNTILADFLGIDKKTAERMTSATVDGWANPGFGNEDVRPRHAVRLLEIFLETGMVDWLKAMGRSRGGNVTKVEKAALRVDEMMLKDAA